MLSYLSYLFLSIYVAQVSNQVPKIFLHPVETQHQPSNRHPSQEKSWDHRL
jgi:hypothetical protein